MNFVCFGEKCKNVCLVLFSIKPKLFTFLEPNPFVLPTNVYGDLVCLVENCKNLIFGIKFCFTFLEPNPFGNLQKGLFLSKPYF